MWAVLGAWLKRRQPLPPPTAWIGWRASPSALRQMIAALPDHPRIGVIEVERARALLSELDGAPIIVADLI